MVLIQLHRLPARRMVANFPAGQNAANVSIWPKSMSAACFRHHSSSTTISRLFLEQRERGSRVFLLELAAERLHTKFNGSSDVRNRVRAYLATFLNLQLLKNESFLLTEANSCNFDLTFIVLRRFCAFSVCVLLCPTRQASNLTFRSYFNFISSNRSSLQYQA